MPAISLHCCAVTTSPFKGSFFTNDLKSWLSCMIRGINMIFMCTHAFFGALNKFEVSALYAKLQNRTA